jgi:hypothetical protein
MPVISEATRAGVLVDGFSKFLEPFGRAAMKAGLPSLFQDDVHQPVDQGDVGARALAQVQRGELGDIDAARVGHDQLDAALQDRLADHGAKDRVLLGGVGADDEAWPAACSATSSIELDMAPEPKEVARPATVLECQRRAQ